MKITSNFSSTLIDLDVRESLELIRQLSTAIDRALANGQGSFCNGCISERTPSAIGTLEVPGVINVVVRSTK